MRFKKNEENLLQDTIKKYKTEFNKKKVKINTKKFKKFFEEWKNSNYFFSPDVYITISTYFPTLQEFSRNFLYIIELCKIVITNNLIYKWLEI